jgi:vacuolar-type H+-ATPase subunit F/Vma7
MLNACFIGDTETAAGFGLVGVKTHALPADQRGLQRLVERERRTRDLIILSSDCRDRLGTELERLIGDNPLPPVITLPAEGSTKMDGIITEAYHAIGLGPVEK